MEHPLNSTVELLRDSQKKAAASAAESEDVKSGSSTVEEELQEPGYVLHNQIVENTISILQAPVMLEAFKVIGASIGDEVTSALVNVMVISMTNSAHQAILFYDELLKGELTKQFDNIGEHINMMKSEMDGQLSAMKVFRKELTEIEQKIQIDEFKKQNGVSDQ